MLSQSPHVSVRVTDHVQRVVTAEDSACDFADADNVLSTEADVTPSQKWRIDIAQVPCTLVPCICCQGIGKDAPFSLPRTAHGSRYLFLA